MQVLFRSKFIFAGFLAAALLCAAPAANARTHHKHHHHHGVRHHVKSRHAVHADVRTAQIHLIHLGYLKGGADGKLGPKTAAALRKFQKDQHLPVTGKLTTATYNALVEADMPILPLPTMTQHVPSVSPSQFYAKNPDFYGKYDQQYANPMVTAPTIVGHDGNTETKTQSMPTRYGKLEVSEDMRGRQKRYNIYLNDQSLLTVDNQPSVIGISTTYDLGSEDAIILTTYNDGNTSCAYKQYLLTLNNGGNNLQEIGNCTRGYQAHVAQGSLFIEFPEADDGRIIGNMWRYENGRLEKL